MSTETRGEVRLCLSMIVKNESKVIRRCLDAALPVCDAFLICDTGSEDDTVELIRKAGKDHHRDGVVVTDEWKNFAHNRSRAAKLTKDFVTRQHPDWDLARSYMLLVDADMVLRVSATFNKEGLTEPCYDLEQRSPGLSWFNVRLCRLDHDWRAVSVTHEYWSATPPLPSPFNPRISTVHIDDIGDGGCHAEKFERDIKLLTQGIVDEPDNVRYYFYLAQSLFDVGRYAEAIPHYEKRRTMGGFYEEVWYSRYRIGLCHLRLGDTARGMEALLSAYEDRPSRAEPLVALAAHFRSLGKNRSALAFAELARKIPLSGDSLFVETPAYTYLPLSEISIAAFYVPGERETGRQATEALVRRRDLPEHHRQNALRTQSFYCPTIVDLATKTGVFEIPEEIARGPAQPLGLKTYSTTIYLPKNPSIALHRGSYVVTANLVNYHHERGVVFSPKDPDGIVRTRNVVFRCARRDDLPIEGALSEITPTAWPEGWSDDPRVRGLEDLRIVSHKERIWFTATTYHPRKTIPEVVLGRLDETLSSVEFLTTLPYDKARACEKNWLPWSANGSLYLLYSYDPFVLLRVDETTGQCTETPRRAIALRSASSWRGGAAPVLGPVSILSLVHEVAHFPDRRVYMHRWVEHSSHDFGIVRYSKPFCFDRVGVEYATGLVRMPADMHEDPLFTVTYGSDEREARWATFSWPAIDDILTEKVIT